MKQHTKSKLLVLILAFVLTFGLAACERNNAGEADTPTGAVTETTKGTEDATTGTVGDAVGDTVGDAVDNTIDVVGAAAETVAGAVGDAAQSAEEAIGDARTDAADTVADAGGDVNAEVADARSQVVSSMEGLDLTDESEPNIEIVKSALTEARDNLANAYANASEVAQAQWEELQPQFAAAEAALRDNAAEGLQQVQALLERLQQDVAQ